MAHNIDNSNGRDNIAFIGSRNDVWHKLGQEMKPGQPLEVWAREAGLAWTAIKVPAYADMSTIERFPTGPVVGMKPAEGRHFVVRNDTARILSPGTVSDVYQPVQPLEVLEWFDRYIKADDRFALDVAGSLGGGATVWATATFNGALSVAGDKHTARLLMSTTFDGSGATINQGSMTRAVCANTLAVSLMDKRAMIRTRHSTKFDAAKVGRELGDLAKSFDVYKSMGDALAQVEFGRDCLKDFFKDMLGIDRTAKPDDISTRKMNQYRALWAAHDHTKVEGATGAWLALNTITRYVDHDRQTKGAEFGVDEARFTSATFGSGAGMKAQAIGLLMPLVKDKIAA